MSEFQNNTQNINLINYLNQLQNADVIIEVHEKRPVNLFTDEPVHIPTSGSKIFIWHDKYLPLFEEIEKIKFGQIILKIRDFKFIEMKSYFKVRLQKKNVIK